MTIDAFLYVAINVLFRSFDRYGTFDLGKDRTGQGFIYGLTSYFKHVTTNLTVVGAVLCLPGLIAAKRAWTTNKASGLCVLMLIIYTGFFSWRANLDLSNPLLKGVVERFWMQSDVVISILAGLGLHSAIVFLTKSDSVTEKSFGKYTSLFTAALLTTIQLRNFTLCDQSNNYVVRDFAMSLLNSLPNNSLVLTKGDLPTNSMRYLHLCEGVRPDLSILDQEILR